MFRELSLISRSEHRGYNPKVYTIFNIANAIWNSDILVIQLLEALAFLEPEEHLLTICNCCLSYHITICHRSGFLHMVFVRLEKTATMLARRNFGCEERPEGMGSIITLHLCQVHNSNEMQVGNILDKSLPLSKEIQMFR